MEKKIESQDCFFSGNLVQKQFAQQRDGQPLKMNRKWHYFLETRWKQDARCLADFSFSSRLVLSCLKIEKTILSCLVDGE